MIGPRPNPTICATEFPVEYSDVGSRRPTTTTPVVNSMLKATPSSTVSNDTIVGFETDPHSRNPVAYTAHPSA